MTEVELARQVLEGCGVPVRFNAQIGQTVVCVTGGQQVEPRVVSWMQELWQQELGWRTVEQAYIAHFAARFSREELLELVALSKRPVFQKWVREEMNAYRETATAREAAYAGFWQRYNAGEFLPPWMDKKREKRVVRDEFGDLQEQ